MAQRTLANMPAVDETQFHVNQNWWNRYLQEVQDAWLGRNTVRGFNDRSRWTRHETYREFIENWYEVMYTMNTLPNGKRRDRVFEIEAREESELGAELMALKNHVARVYISLIDDDD